MASMKQISKIFLMAFMFMALVGGVRAATDSKIEALGRPLADDSVGYYDRVVDFSENSLPKSVDVGTGIYTNKEITEWTSEILPQLLTLTVANFPQIQALAKSRFTPTGLIMYQNDLLQSNIEDLLKRQNYTLTTMLDGVAFVQEHGVDGNHYHWLLTVPILMTYEGGIVPRTYMMQAEIEIIRVPFTADNPKGLAINFWRIQAR
jgi:hypothetical protein